MDQQNARRTHGSFCGRTRREFLWEAGGGFGSVALTALLGSDGFLARQAVAADGVTPFKNPLAPKAPVRCRRRRRASSSSSCTADPATSIRSTTSPNSTRSTARRSRSRRLAAAARRTRGGSSGPNGRFASMATAASGSRNCFPTWRPVSTTSPSFIRCMPSRRSTARPC